MSGVRGLSKRSLIENDADQPRPSRRPLASGCLIDLTRGCTHRASQPSWPGLILQPESELGIVALAVVAGGQPARSEELFGARVCVMQLRLRLQLQWCSGAVVELEDISEEQIDLKLFSLRGCHM